MNTGVRLGHVGGVEIVVDVSVFVVAVLLAWVNHVGLEATYDPGTVGTVLAIVVALGYIGSLLVHEGAHALIAARRQLRVRRIRLLVFGGYSVIEGRDRSPGDEFWVALSGPVGSMALGGVLWAIAAVIGNGPTADSVLLLAVLNLLLAAFNLLPGIPLDGGKALRAILWNFGADRRRATRTATVTGRVLGLGVATIGLVLIVARGEIAGAIGILLGWFLYRGASAAGEREELAALAAGSTARDVMHPTPEAVPGTLRVADVTALFQTGPRLRTLPVEVGGRITGVIGQAEVDDLAPGRRELGRASSVMTPIGPNDVVDAETPFEDLLLRSATEPRWVVVDSGTVVGIIEAADLESAFG